MTPETFSAIGKAMYGHGWRGQLADALGVARQTIYRYADGCTPISRRIELALDALRAERIREIDAAPGTVAICPSEGGDGAAGGANPSPSSAAGQGAGE